MSELMQNFLESLYNDDLEFNEQFTTEDYDFLCVEQEEIYE